ncbi:hypothetical protein HID58_033408, partial [Brassica napus]
FCFVLGYDRISALPDCLITQILLWLPTRDSIKTSVLSTRWRNLWLDVPGLDLHSNDLDCFSKVATNNFGNCFLKVNHQTRLQKFKINYDNYNSFGNPSQIREWITAVDHRGIQHLDAEDESAKCYICFLPRCLKTLVSLKLQHVVVPKNPESGTEGSVKIDAPRLKYMSFSDRIVVKNLNSLLKIDIDTDFNIKPLILLSEVLSKRDIIHEFLTGIASVTHMIISQPTLEVLYHYSKLGPFPKFHNLSHLQAAFSSSSLPLLSVFLESCSNLKSLVLDFSVSTEPEQKMDLTKVPQCLISTLERVEINKLNMWEGPGMKLATYFIMNSAVLKKLKVVPMTVSGEEVPPQHQVFINCRGDELRKSFLGFVVKAMREAKINRLVGTFGDNFRNLEREYRSEPERVKKWKEALISIPQKVGLTLEGHRDESELVDSIVKEVKKVLIDVSNKKREELGDNFIRHLAWALRELGINSWEEALNFSTKRSIGLSLERHRNEFALVAAIVKEVTRLLPSSRRLRRRRRLGIGEVFIRALTATFLFALFISPMRRTPDVNFLKIGNLLVGFPFLVVVLHKILC